MARKRGETIAEPSMTDEERAELEGRLACMFSKPNRSNLNNGTFFLLWMQKDENGSPHVMMWNPETETEIRAATLFHDAAHGLGEFAKPVKKGKPLQRTPEHDALIQGILHNRDDDTGYLVYADFLTENRNTQGDFIRLCVEMGRLPPESAESIEKNEQMNALLDAHAEEWYAPLRELDLRPTVFDIFSPWLWLSLRHGVIEEVTINRPGVLPKHADRLFAAAPFLRKIEFEKGHLDPSSLAKVKQLNQIEELKLSYTDLAAENLAKILRSKHLTGLKSLLLNGNDIGHAGVHTITRWSGLTRLETLDLVSCDLGPEAISELADCKNISNIRRLRIGNNSLDSDTARIILSSPYLAKVTELDLNRTDFDHTATFQFHSAVFSKTLKRLDLESAIFQRLAFQHFTRCVLPRLISLTLSGVRLRRTEATYLNSAAFGSTLTELFLNGCELGAAGIEALVDGKFPKLETLDLSGNRLGTQGGTAFANAAKCFPALTSLKMCSNRLTPNAVAQLAKSSVLANLVDLDLSSNAIGPVGATALAKSKHLKKLKSLAVDEETIGKKGKDALLACFGEDVVSFR